MTVDLRKLAALRREATPGPWQVVHGVERGDYGSIIGCYVEGVSGVDTRIVEFRDDYGNDPVVDAAYIAAAGSWTAEELEALADAIDELREIVRGIGLESIPRGTTAQAYRKAVLSRFDAPLDRLQETTP